MTPKNAERGTQLRFTGDLAAMAIERIREFEPPEGYWLAFSGGKDSIVVKQLADESGVKYDAHYNVTGIDPPELVRFIRKHYPDVAWERAARPLLAIIPGRGFPTRRARWCCEEYKERGGRGRILLTGLRSGESPRRRKRHGIISHYKVGSNRKTLVNPILDWTHGDVWAFIRARSLPYCCLYDEAWNRLGCVLCPMNTNSARDIARWPGIAKAWRRAFRKLWANRPHLQAIWSTGDAMFEGWANRRGSLDGDLAANEHCELFGAGGSE